VEEHRFESEQSDEQHNIDHYHLRVFAITQSDEGQRQGAMPRCPVCQEEQNADVAAFAHHVNGHFDAQALGTSGVVSEEKASGESPPAVP
jgi:hypothetical protein